MKACSFLPAATQMIYDMGPQDLLYGAYLYLASLQKRMDTIIDELRKHVQA